MHDRRRGDGDLGRAALHGVLQEFVVVGDDAALAPELRLGIGRGGDADPVRRGAEAQRAVAQTEAFDGVDEARRPAAAAELAVGDRAQPEILLERHDFAHAAVLHRREARIVELAGLVGARSLDQALGPQEAADVLGAERRLRAHLDGHHYLWAVTPRRRRSAMTKDFDAAQDRPRRNIGQERSRREHVRADRGMTLGGGRVENRSRLAVRSGTRDGCSERASRRPTGVRGAMKPLLERFNSARAERPLTCGLVP